ncbi:translocation/assembly module TamB [Salinibacter altiplanensis]|uniref:translocation/assembly module TamB n=1 Tax=Salinibacter altiplanensis TaxID=1803181 RepID=UPI001F237B59|nr:translocation/assembly module TamB [Salinibacter altiplanensis]
MAPAPDSSNPNTEPPEDAASGSRARRWGRRLLWGVGGVVGTAVGLVGLVLLGLQTETGATAAAQFLARQANPLPQTTLTVGRASGTWVQSLRLTNVSLTRPDSGASAPASMAHIDTLAVQYRLGALLRGRLHLTSVSLRGPSVTLRQAPDSTWDWARRLPASEPAPGDTSASFPIEVDRFRLTDGAFAAQFYAGGRDSTAQIQDLAVQTRDLRYGSSTGGRLDTLGLRARLPADTTDLRLAVRGALSERQVTLDTLRLTSPRSAVHGHGSARLPMAPSDSLDDVALSLRAAPLVLGDLTAFAPFLEVDPAEALDLRARLTGSGKQLTLATDVTVRNGGGRLTAEATATPRTDAPAGGSPLVYRIDAEAQRLTTSLIGAPAPTENRITATLTGALEGPALDSLNGRLSASVTDTRVYDVQATDLGLESTVRNGAATLDLHGSVNDVGLSVSGSARPFDAAPSMDLEGQVRALPLAAVAPDAGVEGSLTASAQVQGRAMTTDTATYDATVRLKNSRVGAQAIESGRLTAALRPYEVRADGNVHFPTGRLRMAGHAALDGSERFVLETGRVEDVNLAALVGDTTDSRVTATLTGDGQGFDPATMRAQATLDVKDSHYGPHRLDSLTTTTRLRGGRMTADATARLNDSDWSLAAQARPFLARPTVELTKGRFQSVDLGLFLQDSTQSSALHGTVEGRLRGTRPDSLSLDVGLTLDTSRVNQQPITTASLDASLQNGTLRSTLALDAPEGAAEIPVRARPFDETPSYQIDEGGFENLDVGALTGRSSLNTALSGTLTLDADGAKLPALSLESELTLRPSTVNQASVDGRLSVATSPNRIEADGQFTVAGGSLRLQGHLDSLAHTPSYGLRTTARSMDLGALAGLDSTRSRLHTAQWRAHGRGVRWDSLTASTHFVADSIRVDDVRLNSVVLSGRLEHGLFRVDTLGVQSNVGDGHGQGPLALTQDAGTSNFDLQANVTDITPVRRTTGLSSLALRTGRLTAHVYGSSSAQRFDGTVEVDGLIYDDMRLSDVTALFTGRRGTTQLLDQFTITGTAGYLSAFDFTATRTRIEADYDGTAVDLSTDVQLGSDRRIQLGTSLQPAADSTTISVHRLTAQLGPDRWSLRRPTSVAIGDAYRLDTLLLESDKQRIEAQGVVAPSGTQDFNATLEQVRLRGIAPLLGLSGLDGVATGQLRLSGMASAPVLDGTLDLDLRSEDRAVGTLQLDVGYEDLTARLDARFTHQAGSVLTVNGSVPTDLRLQAPTPASLADRSVRLKTSADQFPLDWVDPFFDSATIRSVTGTLTTNASIRGTRGSPKLSGSASVADAGAFLPPINATYRDGRAQLQLAGNELTLESARLHTPNGGSVRADGTISLPQLTVGEYDLTLSASEFLAINTPAYRRAVLDGDLTLRGTVRRPVLSGGVQVQSANVYYAEALAESGAAMGAVELTTQDRLTLEERFGLRLTSADTTTFDTYKAMALDLTVQIQGNTWVRSNSNPEMNVQFTGDLDVQKSSLQSPQIFGTIDVVERRSTLRQFGQEFQITEGSLTFNGDPEAPYLDLTAVYDQKARGSQNSEVRITLSLSGRPDDLSPSLSSEPTMSTRNIFSYLATGRPADALLSGSSEDGNLATQVALGQASNFVEGLAASELGLDVVRFDVRTEGTSYLTVGRYLTPRFFASIEQPVLAPSSQTSTQSTALIPDVTLEYQLTNYLQLRSRSNQQSLQFNLLFEYAY